MRISLSRLELMDVVTVDGISEVDSLSSKFREFVPVRKISTHRVIGDEVRRPDMISYREYGTPYLWWFVLKVNSIDDPFSLVEGALLKIPNVTDYYDFVEQNASS